MKRKPRILHTITWLAPGGGVDIAVASQIEALHSHFDYDLISGKVVNENVLTRLPYIHHEVCPHLDRKIKPFQDLRSIWYFYNFIKKGNYDIVHTHEAKGGVIGRIAASLAGVPIVIFGLEGVVFNDPMPSIKRSFFVRVERMTAAMNDFVIPVGKETIQAYHEEKIGLDIPHQVIYGGVDLQPYLNNIPSPQERAIARKEWGLSDEDILLVNVGRFSSSKAQRYLIEMMSLSKSQPKNVKLLLVGAGECEDDCRELAKKLEVEDRVIFHGRSSEVPKLLHLSDIFVMTSLREGLPRVIVEASLAKLPSVVWAVEGAAEVIDSGSNGYIVDTGKVEALWEKVEELIKSPSKRKEFGDKVFGHAVQNWDLETSVQKVKSIYNKLLSQKGIK